MYILSNPLKGDSDRKAVENLANAIIIQAANDYLESKKDLYQYGYAFEVESRLIDTTKFFKSQWYDVLCSIDGTRLMRMLDKEFEDWRREYEANRRRR